jgi:hypothetical protein
VLWDVVLMELDSFICMHVHLKNFVILNESGGVFVQILCIWVLRIGRLKMIKNSLA